MPKRTLDVIDRKILEHLQVDGRMSLNDLADKVGLSPSPCLRRVRMLEKDGVIARYVAVLDQRAVGLPVSVFVSIKLEKQREESLDRFAKAVARSSGVLPDDRVARLLASRGRSRPRRLRAVRQTKAHEI
jgi:Lrp/AsnC family leucine-responsive transcriptional regulator